MTNKQKEIYELLKQEVTLLDLAGYLNLTPKQAYNRVQTIKNQGYNIHRKDFSTGDIQFSIINPLEDNTDENILYTLPNNQNLRTVILSDLHIGNALQRLDVLDEVYNYCIKNNIHTIFNCGDLLQGLLGLPNLILQKDYEKQINMFLKFYPFDSSIINLAILGNHDIDFFNSGVDLKQIINNKRFDIKVLNYGDSLIKVKNDKIRLIHPLDNRLKMNFMNDSKIIFRGHSHISKIKTHAHPGTFCAFVPTCSDLLMKDGCSYPMIYDVDFIFNKNGLITQINILLYIYVDKFIKVSEFSHTFHDCKSFKNIKYEETPKKLTLTK